jgi:uncharacterized protein (TIGR02271 family)
VLRLAEEQLTVGKRLVQEGTTRIRRFITENPVETQITLHEEHVKVVRRAVANPPSLQDIDWTDTMMEVTDTVEQPVISKSAHIAEEIVIRREASDRVEIVRDTVRRQEIQVENVDSKEQTGNPPKTMTPKP